LRHATPGRHFILGHARPAATRRLAQTLGRTQNSKQSLASFGLRFEVGARWNLLLQLKDLPARLYSQCWKPRFIGWRAAEPVDVNS
jgi:hypothetical protein